MPTILLIEASDMTCSSTSTPLEKAGFDVIESRNGSYALQVLKNLKPDLVICNTQLPDMSGYEVLTILRNTPSTHRVPCILCSTSISYAECRKAMQLGANDLLQDPIQLEELLEAILLQITEFKTIAPTGFASLREIATLKRPGIFGV
ncbi:MAG: response regulator [Oculatellaceae cyanobacterium bins.114]|nr:response regulator [Oculatellaceae cyanobacterium bins.114]